jgi:drug/metabolite transporter (DMT)-like permease
MLLVLISTLSQAGNVLLDRIVLSKRQMHLGQYIPLIFVFLFLSTFITLPWLGSVNLALAFNQQYIFYFVLMILLAIIWNIFSYQGLQKEKMVEYEMIMMLTPIVTIMMASLFFPEEFNLPIFLAGVVGSIALVASHLKDHHLQFSKYAVHLVLAVILMAMEAMVQKELLQVYSPATLYAIRTGILALFFTIYYRPNLHEVNDLDFRIVLGSGVLGAVHFVLKLYGFNEIGVTFTTLILLLVPVIVTWVDSQVNKVQIRRRTLVAFVIILACVAYAAASQGY